MQQSRKSAFSFSVLNLWTPGLMRMSCLPPSLFVEWLMSTLHNEIIGSQPTAPFLQFSSDLKWCIVLLNGKRDSGNLKEDTPKNIYLFECTLYLNICLRQPLKIPTKQLIFGIIQICDVPAHKRNCACQRCTGERMWSSRKGLYDNNVKHQGNKWWALTDAKYDWLPKKCWWRQQHLYEKLRDFQLESFEAVAQKRRSALNKDACGQKKKLCSHE